MDYIKNVPDKYFGREYQQWITLFDDFEDDEFDGELNEDDEEMPMIRTMISINAVDKNTLVKAKPSPPRKSQTVETKQMKKPDWQSVAQVVASPRKPSMAKRKTVVITESGSKKVVNTDDLLELQKHSENVISKVKNRRQTKKEKIADVFGDFFGFGANPPGCLAKGAPAVNFKAEKERFIQILKEEQKKYDLTYIKIDLESKIEQLSKVIKKEEKNIMVSEVI